MTLVSTILLKLPPDTQNTLGHAIRMSLLRPFVEMNGHVSRAKTRFQDYDLLRVQMDSLLTLVAAQRTLAEENRQLRSLVDLELKRPSRMVAATVLRSGTLGSESIFHLDAGATDGIAAFDAVVTESGLLGQVQEVQARSATAFDWSHLDFRVSAMTPDGLVHGLVEPVRGSFREQDRLVLRGTAFLSDLEPGTEVVTSGRGGAFSRGIRIGWISGVAETSAGWSKSYNIKPAVHPGAVTFALVEVGGAESLQRDSAAGSPEDSLSGGAEGLQRDSAGGSRATSTGRP